MQSKSDKNTSNVQVDYRKRSFRKHGKNTTFFKIPGTCLQQFRIISQRIASYLSLPSRCLTRNDGSAGPRHNQGRNKNFCRRPLQGRATGLHLAWGEGEVQSVFLIVSWSKRKNLFREPGRKRMTMPCQCLPSLATKRTKGTLPPTKLPIPGGGLISLHIRQASSSNCARLKFAKTLCVVLKFSSPLSVERLSALSYLRVLWSDCLLLYRLQTPGTLITTARTSVPITTQPSNIDRCLKTGIKIHEHKTVEQTAMTRWRYGGNGNTRSYTRLTDVIAARQYWCSLSAAHALTPIQAPHHTLMQQQEKKFFKRNKSLWIHVVEILASLYLRVTISFLCNYDVHTIRRLLMFENSIPPI